MPKPERKKGTQPEAPSPPTGSACVPKSGNLLQAANADVFHLEPADFKKRFDSIVTAASKAGQMVIVWKQQKRYCYCLANYENFWAGLNEMQRMIAQREAAIMERATRGKRPI